MGRGPRAARTRGETGRRTSRAQESRDARGRDRDLARRSDRPIDRDEPGAWRENVGDREGEYVPRGLDRDDRGWDDRGDRDFRDRDDRDDRDDERRRGWDDPRSARASERFDTGFGSTRRRLPERSGEEWEGSRRTRGGNPPRGYECPTCGQWSVEASSGRGWARDEDEGARSSLPRRGGRGREGDEPRTGGRTRSR
jgi:hypothetical protein